MSLMTDDFEGHDLLSELTAKQREVLDLLIQHKTSKQISRMLDISPHTVDQRIMLARAKLKVGSRNEVAELYARLVSAERALGLIAGTYEQSIYQQSDLAPAADLGHSGDREDGADIAPAPTGSVDQMAADREEAGFYHVLPEAFDGPNGTLLRLGTMAAIAILLILIGLGGLSMFAQLSAMFDR